MKRGILYMALLLLMVSLASAAMTTKLSLQGEARTSSGDMISSGDIHVIVDDESSCSGSSPLLNQTFASGIVNGRFDELLTLSLNYNEDYYLCLYIEDEQVGGPYQFRGGQGEINTEDLADAGITGDDISPSAALSIANLSISGRVGIGTSSPIRKLNVYEDEATSYMSIQSSISGIAGLLLGDTARDYGGRVEYDNSNDSLNLWTNNAKVLTLSNRKMGLGSVTSPTVDAVIRSGSSNTATRLYLMPYGTPSAGLQSGIKMFGTDYIADATNYNDFGLWAGSDYNYINSKQNGIGVAKDFLFTYNDGSGHGGDDLMIIKTSGNVGIGTTAPANKLNVIGTVNATSFVGDGSQLSGITSGLWTNSSGNATFVGGNVGIGTTEPNANLDIVDEEDASKLYVRSNVSFSRIHMHGYYSGWGNGLLMYQARGNSSSPAASQDGDVLLRVAGQGYDGSSFTTSRADIVAKAAEDWNTTAQGADFIFYTTPKGSSSKSERMRISSEGYVGIGTASPNGALTIGGDRNIRTSGGNSIHVRSGNTDVNTYLYVMPSGTPASGSSEISLFSSDFEENTTNWERLNFLKYKDGDAIIVVDKGGNGSYRNLSFKAGNAERLKIDANGNVGIGTTAPLYGLDIVGDNGGAQLRLSHRTDDLQTKNAKIVSRHYNNSEEDVIGMQIYSTETTNSIRIGGTSSLQNTATDINFYTAENTTATTGTKRMVIDSSGNVGIGTNNPLQRLVSVGSIPFVGSDIDSDLTSKNFRMGLLHYNISEEPLGLVYGQSTSIVSRVVIGGGSGSLNTPTQIEFRTANDTTTTTGDVRMIIDSSGNVGIGTASPSHKLNVVGDINATGSIYKNGGTAVDYVFDSYFGVNTNAGYEGMVPLENLQDYLSANRHLPRLEQEKYTGQYEVGDMDEMLLEKIEEAYLYIVKLKAENDALKARVEALENR